MTHFLRSNLIKTLAQFYTREVVDIHKYYKNMALHLENGPLVCLWKWVSKGLQLVSYCEVVGGGSSEMGRKVLAPDTWLITCKQQFLAGKSSFQGRALCRRPRLSCHFSKAIL